MTNKKTKNWDCHISLVVILIGRVGKGSEPNL
jgi:hypothetical protein